MKYPYLPKSNTTINVGDYFPVQVYNDLFAYCVVLGKPGKSNRVMIHIGVLNITGKTKLIEVHDFDLVYQTRIHCKVIDNLDTMIFGNIKPPDVRLEINCHGGEHCYVISGYDSIRLATNEDKKSLPVSSVSGHIYLKNQIIKLVRS